MRKTIGRTRTAWSWPRISKLLGQGAAYILLMVGAVFVSIPWLWMFLTSLKTPADILRLPLTILPTQWVWHNYVEVFAESTRPMYRTVLNTLTIVLFGEIGILLSNATVAFSFSRLRWKARDILFVVVLATMMLPAQVTMIPLFVIFSTKLHWNNTYLPLIVPTYFGAPAYIFLMRQYMRTIPPAIDDAARIDGCSTWQLFLRIILPMSAPVLAVIAIFAFNGVWNDFFHPLLYIDDPNLYTVALFVASFSTQVYPGQPIRIDLLMAASVLSSMPMAILFFIFQRQFIQGVVITGVKG
jgi:ABC-type glycerol-3-phosphate transport system permease component